MARKKSGNGIPASVRTKQAIEYIEAFYDHSITLDDVASNCGMSVSRLSHVFKEELGQTVVDYLTATRLTKAKHMLINTDKQCSDIGCEVGYDSPAYFTRIFKRKVGLTPSEYRSANNQNKKTQ